MRQCPNSRALRLEGHVDTGREAISGLVKEAISTFQVHASRTEHGPPYGGRETLLLAAINIALLAEGKKSKTTEPLRNTSESYKSLNHTRCAPGLGLPCLWRFHCCILRSWPEGHIRDILIIRREFKLR